MRQKQIEKEKSGKSKAAFIKLGPKEHTVLFTGSPAAVTTNQSTADIAAKKNKNDKSQSHPALNTQDPKDLTKINKSRKSSLNASVQGLKARKYRPGTTALQEIRKYQKGTDLLIKRAPFQRLAREVTNELTDEATRFTADALECLQTSAEAFIIQIFEDSVLAMIHAKRVTLMVRDIQFIRRLRGI